MSTGTRHKVSRAANGSGGRATLRPMLAVRVLEALYPSAGDGIKFVTELDGRWLYTFHQPPGGIPLLKDEIWAERDVWRRMAKPGSNAGLAEAAAAIVMPPGVLGLGALTGQYFFFASRARLSAEARELLTRSLDQQAKNHQASSDAASFASLSFEGVEFAYDPSCGVGDATCVASQLSCPRASSDRRIAVLVTEPFTWTEDVALLGYQGALDVHERFSEAVSVELAVAQLLKGARDLDDDALGVANEIATAADWLEATPRSLLERSGGLTRHPDGLRGAEHRPQPNHANWRTLRSSKDAIDARIAGYDAERVALLAHLKESADLLLRWLGSPGHQVVSKACEPSAEGDDRAAIGVHHYAVATDRLADVPSGREWLKDVYTSDTQPFIKKFIASGQRPSPTWSSVQRVATLGIKLVENCMGTLVLVEGPRMAKIVEGVLTTQPIGAEVRRLDLDKSRLPKKLDGVFKKLGAPTKLRILQISVDGGTAAGTSKRFFEQYRIKNYFAVAKVGIGGINLLFTLDKVMSQKTTDPEKYKAALDFTSFALSVPDLRRKLLISDIEAGAGRYGTEQTAEEMTLVRNAKAVNGLIKVASGLISIVSGFIDAYISIDAGTRSWVMDKDYDYAVLQYTGAVLAGVGVYFGAIGLLAGEAAGGPVGWIALALTVIGLVVTWLASKVKNNDWERVAYHSYLGKGHIHKKEQEWYRELFGNTTSGAFGRRPSSQLVAILGLLSSFRLESLGYAEAKQGIVRIYPGFVGPAGVFRVIWQFEYAGGGFGVYEAMVRPNEPKFDEVRAELSGPHPDGILDLDASYLAREDGGIKYLDLKPRLKLRSGSFLLPVASTVMVQARPVGDESLQIPFDVEPFEVENGPLAGQTWSNVIGFRGTALGQEIVVAVS